MNSDEAVEKLAQLLKERAANDIARAKQLLGDRAEVQPNDVDYRKLAEQMLHDEVVTSAYHRITEHNLFGNCEHGAPYRDPPMPR